jgi:hypothetical protein
MRRIGALAFVLAMLATTACAALKATEGLPSPTGGLQGGPEDEPESLE